MAAETDSPPRQRSGGGNVFTRKIGPLPMWVWLAIVTAMILGYAYWKNRQSSSTSTPSSTADASQVPQFVNQTYTTVQPPSAPGTAGATGPAGPAGPPGPAGPGGTGATTSGATGGGPANTQPAIGNAGTGIGILLPGASPAAQGAVNLKNTGIGNQYNTAASKTRAQSRKNARIAARKKK